MMRGALWLMLMMAMLVLVAVWGGAFVEQPQYLAVVRGHETTIADPSRRLVARIPETLAYPDNSLPYALGIYAYDATGQYAVVNIFEDDWRKHLLVDMWQQEILLDLETVSIECAAISPGGEYVAVCDTDGGTSFVLWDVGKGERLLDEMVLDARGPSWLADTDQVIVNLLLLRSPTVQHVLHQYDAGRNEFVAQHPSGEYSDVSWFPDGCTLLTTHPNVGAGVQYLTSDCVQNRPMGGRRLGSYGSYLGINQYVARAQVSPDGRLIAASVGDRNQVEDAQIYLFDVDTETLTRLTSLPNPWGDTIPPHELSPFWVDGLPIPPRGYRPE